MATRDWIITILSCLLAVISPIITLYWFYLWKWHKKEGSNNDPSAMPTNKTFSILNVSAIIFFSFVAIFVFIRCVVVLSNSLNNSSQVNFSANFESDVDSDFIDAILLLAAIFYLIGKYQLYFILYLRLFFALHGSMFEYPPKYYKIMKGLIIGCLICPFASLICGILQFLAGSIIFTAIFIVLDVTYPIGVNILFIRKLYQVGTFFIQRKLKMANSSDVNNNNNNSNSKDSQTSQQVEKLLSVLAKFTVLSVTAALSSMLLLGSLTIIFSFRDDSKVPVPWVLMAVDANINLLCLILYFNFSNGIYKTICTICTTQCVVRVMPTILCSCCKQF